MEIVLPPGSIEVIVMKEMIPFTEFNASSSQSASPLLKLKKSSNLQPILVAAIQLLNIRLYNFL